MRARVRSWQWGGHAPCKGEALEGEGGVEGEDGSQIQNLGRGFAV